MMYQYIFQKEKQWLCDRMKTQIKVDAFCTFFTVSSSEKKISANNDLSVALSSTNYHGGIILPKIMRYIYMIRHLVIAH